MSEVTAQISKAKSLGKSDSKAKAVNSKAAKPAAVRASSALPAPGDVISYRDNSAQAQSGKFVSRAPAAALQPPRSLRTRPRASLLTQVFYFGMGATAALVLFTVAGKVSSSAMPSFITKVLHRAKIIEAAPLLSKGDAQVMVPRETAERTVEAYTAKLSNELEKVRDYEEKLKKRAAALQSLLNDTLELDPEATRDSTSENAGSLGMGGSDGPSTPIIRMPKDVVRKARGAKRKKNSFPLFQPSAFLSEFDETLVKLDQLPIGTPVQGDLSSGFGWRRSPFSRRVQIHEGLDIATDYRTEVVSTADGVVRQAGYLGAYGQTVLIDHGNGIETLYGHLSQVSVEVGQQICRGQLLGLVGSTGRSTGPHVHYEVRRNGVPRNPEPFVALASLLRLL